VFGGIFLKTLQYFSFHSGTSSYVVKNQNLLQCIVLCLCQWINPPQLGSKNHFLRWVIGYL